VDTPERIALPKTFPPHPRLFMNQKEIDALKAWADDEPWLRRYVDAFVRKCLRDARREWRPGRDEGSNLALAEKAHHFALAYVLSGERKLAEAAAGILRGYVEACPTYAVSETKGLATTAALSEATWAFGVAAAYDFIYSSGALTETDKKGIEDNAFRPSAEVMRDCNHRYRSNWRNRAFAGFGVFGFCMGDRELVDEALNGFRDESGRLVRDGFAQQLAAAVLADGVYYERTMGYHHAAIANYSYLMEAARHSGVDLWHADIGGVDLDAGADVERAFGPTGRKTIRALFDAPLYNAFPDYSLASVANSKGMSLKHNWCYEAAWRAYGDPRYAWVARRGRRTRRPEQPVGLMWMCRDLPQGEFGLARDARIGHTGRHVNACTLFPNGGYAVLRRSTSRSAPSVQMTFGKYGSGHSHPDKLGIVVYGRGSQAVAEVNHYRYGDPEHLTWNNQTIAHNTVTADETAQYPQGTHDDPWVIDTAERPARGRPVLFHPGERLRAFRAECDTAYRGVVLDRTIALVDSVLVDFYRVRSADKHRYDYALHLDGRVAGCSPKPGPPRGKPLSGRPGYGHIVGARRAPLKGAARLTCKPATGRKNVRLDICLLPDGRAELVVAKGAKDKKGRRRPVVLVRRRAADADFVTVMSFRGARAKGLAARRVEGLPGGVLGVELVRPSGRTDVVLSAETPRTVHYAGQRISGQLALLRVRADGSADVIDVVA